MNNVKVNHSGQQASARKQVVTASSSQITIPLCSHPHLVNTMTTLLETSFCVGSNLPRSDSSRIFREERHKMLGKLRHQFSGKGKSASRTASMKPEENNHPEGHLPPPTRRPAVLPTRSNPFRDMGEAPPPYSAAPKPYTTVPNAAPAIQLSSPPAASGAPAANQVADDPYSFLCSFDTIFLIDDSGSMSGGRWRETESALRAITPICTAHDADGIDIYFLNSPDSPTYRNITSDDRVRQVFMNVKPGGGTPTGQKLNNIIKPYLKRYAANPDGTKPVNVICITDGEPSDDVESPLIACAKKLDKLDAPAWQVGVQFFQVGRNEEAKRHLRQLDDELAEISGNDDLRDIVDTVPFTGEEGTKLTGDGILKVVLGAVNRRLDKKKSKDLHR